MQILGDPTFFLSWSWSGKHIFWIFLTLKLTSTIFMQFNLIWWFCKHWSTSLLLRERSRLSVICQNWAHVNYDFLMPGWFFYFYLKGQSHEIFASGFFHESSSPKPLKITVGPFIIYLKIRRDIRKSMCITSINDTGGKFVTGIIEKIRSGPNGILRGVGKTDSWKKPEVENLVALSF
jgi:hypothetical protein